MMELSKSEEKRIEKNRQKAEAIRQSRLVAHPYLKGETAAIEKSTIKIGTTKYRDTGGGFLLEEEEVAVVVTQAAAAPVLELDRPNCETCNKPISSSELYDNFNYKCCNECKDAHKHKLITKTEALHLYLLKEADLTIRPPPLKFITRKNPHNVHWGDMKLYLQVQVEERALQVWDSMEHIKNERLKREENKVLAKTKKYQKNLKQLRMGMRSSLFNRTLSNHVHVFGEETYNEDEDTFSKTCSECDFKQTYEKM